ncbi:MAG: hypothetical protein ABIS67_10300 [Candidatus Eisenbacteria bacterium]
MTPAPIRRRAARAGAALALALLARESVAASSGSQRLNFGVSLSSAYDSNILEYSQDQLTLFEGGTRPDRFSLESTDDLVWNPALTLDWERSDGRRRRHALRLKAEADFHQKNGTADFRAASVRWRESWHRDRQLSIGWYRLPQFYLRQLFDEDYVPPFPGLSRYRRASFSLDIGSTDWSQRVGKSNSLGLGFQYERRRYNQDFRERDSDTNQGEITWGWKRLPHRGALELRGLYRLSDAKAEDGDEVAGVPPDDADLSYHGLAGGVHGEMELDRSRDWRFLGDADYQFATRDYDSKRVTDRYHLGRSDQLHTLELGVSARWKPNWRARLFWQFDRNMAKLGTSAPSSTDTGDYTRSQAGLRLDWSVTAWRSKSAAAEGDE